MRIEKKDFEGMMVQGGRLTPWYLVEAALTVADREIAKASDISYADRVELTMIAGGYQKPLTARLHPYWDAAREEGGTDQITVTGGTYLAKDFRRFD